MNSRQVEYNQLLSHDTDIDAVANTLRNRTGDIVEQAIALRSTTNLLIAMQVWNNGDWIGRTYVQQPTRFRNWNFTKDTVVYLFDLPPTASKEDILKQVDDDVEEWRTRAKTYRRLLMLQELLQPFQAEFISSYDVGDLAGAVESRLDYHKEQPDAKRHGKPFGDELMRRFDARYGTPPVGLGNLRWHSVDDLLSVVDEWLRDTTKGEY